MKFTKVQKQRLRKCKNEVGKVMEMKNVQTYWNDVCKGIGMKFAKL